MRRSRPDATQPDGYRNGRDCRSGGGVGVLHRGGTADAEHAHEADGVGGVAGLVEDPILAELRGAHAKRPRAAVDHPHGDGQMGGVDGALPADQQVGVAGVGPAPPSLTKPGGGERVGELVQVDSVAPALRWTVSWPQLPCCRSIASLQR